MSVKREISTSVSDLHVHSVSDSIKRLAISVDGHPEKKMPLTIRQPESITPSPSSQNILSIMSNARDDFNSRYEILREIGKGGFSIVYQCRSRETGKEYAVKVVDLRPLRLRERFNPSRLKREVDIMRRLDHPNIIKFIEVYEDADHLMMVMEYCPGMELFDVILARKFLREDDARPIFAQVARALYYLHSLSIIHRDIKPENILIMHDVDPLTGLPIAKLLDFGLSKNAGAGSVAKTFVGTPCYLAPEVEYTSKGLGGTYGLAADCWSLGAVLYVMLVARFPEFEQDITGKVVVKLPPMLWNNISTEAKELIRGLMNTNPNARLAMQSVLMHPWLGQYRLNEKQLAELAVKNSELGHRLQEEEVAMEEERNSDCQESVPELTAGGTVIQHHAMIIRQNDNHANNTNSSQPAVELKLAPLLHLQRSIATCFEEAHRHYQDYPEVAAQVRRGAALCRQQLVESTKMLRKVEQTSKEVLEMFPDLELAVEEEEPKLAADFFNLVKSWVAELREQVSATQKINKASMNQIQKVVEQSTIGLKEQQEAQRNNTQTVNISKKLLEALMSKLNIHDSVRQIGNGDHHSYGGGSANTTDDRGLDANQVLELFYSLFSAHQQQIATITDGQTNRNEGSNKRFKTPAKEKYPEYSPRAEVLEDSTDGMDYFQEAMSSEDEVVVPPKPPNNSNPYTPSGGMGNYTVQSPPEPPHLQPAFHDTVPSSASFQDVSSISSPLTISTDDHRRDHHGVITTQQEVLDMTREGPSPRAANRLTEALHKLREVSETKGYAFCVFDNFFFSLSGG